MNSSKKKNKDDNEAFFNHVVEVTIGGVDLFIPFVSKPDADFYVSGLLSVAKRKHASFVAQIYNEDGLIDTTIYPPAVLN